MTAKWIRNNVFSGNELKRQLTETELKIQESLKKFSIPDWYLSERLNPLKLLKSKPNKYRVLSWKNPTSRRSCTSNSSSSDSIDILPHTKENVHEEAKKVAPAITSYENKIVCQQMSPETEHTRSSTRSPSPNEEILDGNISIMKSPTKTPETFPKMSPSRKIHNINLVFPPGQKTEFIKDCFKDMRNDDCNGDDSTETFVLKARLFNVDRATKTEDLRNVDVIMEEDKRGENRQTNVGFQASQAVTTPLNAPDVKPKSFKLRANSTRKFSQADLFSAAIIESNRKKKILSPSILEKSLIFENKSMDVSNKSKNIRRSKKICPNLLEKTSIFEKSSTHNSSQESSNPIDLELPLRSKQLNRKKNIVQEIVRNLNEKMRESLQPRHSQSDNKECFVKQIVNAFEKGDISKLRSLSSGSSINDEDSPSESETKSYVTSNSPKDTDYSYYGRRSSTLNSDEDQTFNSEYFKEDTLKRKEKDSVYYISIPKCTPLSSSPYSMASKLSRHGHSPCISPIKSPNESEYSLQINRRATSETSNTVTKKLFRKAVVIDSGYYD